ncbi:MAG TPA: hydrogenase small subunit [Steroidobacteraceae bacterium]|nr:hydrogenase small subunit [Steroidobacteraceae bacterium]
MLEPDVRPTVAPDLQPTIGELLARNGVSRRAFIKYCTGMASLLALPPLAGRAMAQQLRAARRPSVIYLSFQECTGCLESLTRSFAPTLESLLFDVISLDYDDTLQAAAGKQAEDARDQAMKENFGKYIVLVDGSVPTSDGGVYSCAGGRSAVDVLTEAAKGAAAIVCIGTCSAFGGIPHADPNPTGARAVSDIIHDKPIINVSGCPPIPEVITGTLLQFVTTGQVPDLDAQGRPVVFFGNSIHDRCYRRPFYDQGKFAKTFDDEGARSGWCLYELGCKGPTTYNACATVKWNGGVSFPIESGHPCIGCAEPDFWDRGSFYSPIASARWGKAGEVSPREAAEVAAGAVAVGAALGVGSVLLGRHRQAARIKESEPPKGE